MSTPNNTMTSYGWTIPTEYVTHTLNISLIAAAGERAVSKGTLEEMIKFYLVFRGYVTPEFILTRAVLYKRNDILTRLQNPNEIHKLSLALDTLNHVGMNETSLRVMSYKARDQLKIQC